MIKHCKQIKFEVTYYYPCNSNLTKYAIKVLRALEEHITSRFEKIEVKEIKGNFDIVDIDFD